MADQDTTFANVARALAVQFPPDWSLPSGLSTFALPDREIVAYCRVTRVEVFKALRAIARDRLEGIGSGMHYAYRGTGSDCRRFALDRAEAYHRLWWVDVFIAVYTRRTPSEQEGGMNGTIQEARRKFLGSRLWRELEDVEDGADASITIHIEHGHGIEMTLGDLRALKADLEQNDVAALLEACEAAQPHVCSLLCPSVWKTGEERIHHELCAIMRTLCARARK